MRLLLTLLLCSVTMPLTADIVVPTRTLRPGDILTTDVVRILEGDRVDSYTEIIDVIGQEARTALYANRPILFDQLGPPALIERNQIIQLKFAGSSLVISTEGRALERGGVGDRVRIMNLSSRTTLFGYVQADGHVAVYQ